MHNTYRDAFTLPPPLTLVDILVINRSVFLAHRALIFSLCWTANIELHDIHLWGVARAYMLPITSGWYRQSLFKCFNFVDSMVNCHHVLITNLLVSCSSPRGDTRQIPALPLLNIRWREMLQADWKYFLFVNIFNIIKDGLTIIGAVSWK